MYVRVMSGTGLQAAIKGLRAAVDAVAGCDLTLATDTELLGALDDLEMVACQLPALQQKMLARLQTETTPNALGAHNWKEVLKARYRITGGEACCASLWMTMLASLALTTIW